MSTEVEIGVFEAKNKLSSLLDAAAGGQRIWITRRGRRVALLSSGLNAGSSLEDSPLEILRGIRRRSAGGHSSIRDLIAEGRR